MTDPAQTPEPTDGERQIAFAVDSLLDCIVSMACSERNDVADVMPGLLLAYRVLAAQGGLRAPFYDAVAALLQATIGDEPGLPADALAVVDEHGAADTGPRPPTPARRRTDKTVASILAPMADNDVEDLITIYNRLAGDHVHAVPRRFTAELAAAMAEHLADRQSDPLWTLRHTDVLDGGRS